MKTKVLAILILAVALSSSACATTTGTMSTTETSVPAPTARGDTVSASGVVQPATWINLSFASGGQNLNLRVDVGEDVAKRDLLATVDPSSAEVAIDSATAQVADAKANLARLEDLDASDEAIEAAEAAVKAAESGLAEANRMWSRASLHAPFDGTVVEIYARSGENAAPGAPLLLLADLTTLQVETTDLSEVDVARVSVGDVAHVSFDALPGTETTGEVTRIASKNSSGSGVYYVVTVAPDGIPTGLRWGMSAFVVIDVKP